MRRIRSDACYITESVKCDKCVIQASELVDQLYTLTAIKQKLIYSLKLRNNVSQIYTNMFNIVIDTVFRMTYQFNSILKILKHKHNVDDIIILNDLYAKHEQNPPPSSDTILITNTKTGKQLSRRFAFNLIITAFKKWCLYYELGEEEEYNPIERYLATHYPEYYDFSMPSYRARFIVDPLKHENYKHEKRKVLKKLLSRITDIQTVITPTLIYACEELFLHNIKKNKLKNINIINTDYPINNDILFSLFKDSSIIYITTSHIKTVKSFFIHSANPERLYYPHLNKSAKTFKPIDSSDSELLSHLKSSSHRSSITSFHQLFELVSSECGLGVLDINANYRYTIFENIQKLMTTDLMETIFPNYNEDNELLWITVDEYDEQLPIWISSFNSFNKVKILV